MALFSYCSASKLYFQSLIFLIIFGTIVCPDWGGIWCYRCVSTHPGCGEFNFDWRWNWQWTCPRDDDKCVKLIERKGATSLVTRECLSNLEGIRRDIPADRYEGCRPAAKDVKLGHYIFNDINQLDLKRDYFDEVTYCFCDMDDRCNTASAINRSFMLLTISVSILWCLI